MQPDYAAGEVNDDAVHMPRVLPVSELVFVTILVAALLIAAALLYPA